MTERSAAAPDSAPDPAPDSAPGSAPVGPDGPGASQEEARDRVWQRLDARMLLVHPVREIGRFLPVLIGLVFVGRTTGGGAIPWELLGIVLPVALGLVRYLTTTFRIGAGRVELRRGLLNRQLLSTPLDRVRTVDFEASLVHRLLGLQTVVIGTGRAAGDEDELKLDGLPTERARQVRTLLLDRAVRSVVEPDGVPAAPSDAPEGRLAEPAPAEPVAAFQPRWVWLAPLTFSGLAVGLAGLGLAAQAVNGLGLDERLQGLVVDLGGEPGDAPGAGWWLIGAGAVAVALLAAGVLAIAGYLVTNWGYRLVRAEGAWRVTRGLITTRETSIDPDRLRGVVLGRPIGLRAARGATLHAIVAGLTDDDSTSATLVPPAPAEVARRAAGRVLGSDEPVRVALTRHGPAATRRRHLRAQTGALAVTVAVGAALLLWPGLPRWLLLLAAAGHLVAGWLGHDRARQLGHALTGEGHLVVRSGSVLLARGMLDTTAVIGWHQRASWFQRRAGLCTLVATTAGGAQSYRAPDLPEPVATDLTRRAAPSLVEQFLVAPTATKSPLKR